MKSSRLSSESAKVGLLTAIIASLCCITPVVSLLAGVGGIAASFSWMESFRPYLIALTIAFLGFAWYQKLKPKTKKEIECTCETDEQSSFLQSKKFLGIVTVFAILMLAFPSYSHIFYSDLNNSERILSEQESQFESVEFKIKGMTCVGCESHVTNAISELHGVGEVQASFKEGNAIVKYDPNKVAKDQIIEAINKTGYKVIEKPYLK
jgi:copper chaperone CopZ